MRKPEFPFSVFALPEMYTRPPLIARSVGLSVLCASTGPRTGQFCLSAESQNSKLTLFRPVPRTLSPPLSLSPPKSAPVCGSPTRRVGAARRSAGPCSQTVAESDGSRPGAASYRSCFSGRPPVFTSRCCKLGRGLRSDSCREVPFGDPNPVSGEFA